ncbi:MAG: type VI secretion system baseplate subunit TssG [Alphaproteobacteria bacterium]|jgi:type VI secretion system protein ImpH|nr:type VI secretion system baseplate subunit TssG [Alphaproteobacteria bacterium]MBP9776949.1 type VI secretion system baseplate subunit TssG [Alphaproteobacteria bacterium]
MARTNRQSMLSVKDVLLAEPYRFEFHQAIKLLEYLSPGAALFGETANFQNEVVTVKSRVYLESMASDIYSLENIALESDDPVDGPPILNVNFMGLAGVQGPLPFPYTEMIIQRIRNGDTSLKDFLDIFNHRLISVLHLIRKQYMLSLNSLTPEKTEIAQSLRSFLGIEPPALQNRLHVPDRSLLDYASLYWSHPHSAEGLTSILSSYFHIDVRVEKCVGRWRLIEKDQRTHIGQEGQWQILGQGAALGTRVWDQQNHLRLHLGPLLTEQLDLFLPIGEGFSRFQDLTKLYAGPENDYTLVYTVKDPPSTFLQENSYLGWRSWLGASLTSGSPIILSKR